MATMRNLASKLRTLHKLVYLASMYSGLRGLVGTLRSRLVHARPSRAGRAHGTIFPSRRLGDVHCSVHLRGTPSAGSVGSVGSAVADSGRVWGMLSLRLDRSPLPPLLYRYLCRTSHFGRGHLEAAYYEEGDRCVVYGLRNIARANAHRLGLRSQAHALAIAQGREEAVLFGEVARILAPFFETVTLACPVEAVQLAVDVRLLPRGRESDLVRNLERRYRRLAADCGAAVEVRAG